MQSVPPLDLQFAWRRRAARGCEARRHEGHDVRGGALARGSPLEEDLVQQPLVDAALLVAAGRGGHQAGDRAGRADRVIGAMHEEEAEVAAPAGQERAALGLEAEQAVGGTVTEATTFALRTRTVTVTVIWLMRFII